MTVFPGSMVNSVAVEGVTTTVVRPPSGGGSVPPPQAPAAPAKINRVATLNDGACMIASLVIGPLPHAGSGSFISITRTEAERPIPGPVAPAQVGDNDIGLEPGELSGPA